MKDAKNFDTRAWIVAVGIVLSAFVVLSLGICIVLYKEWQEEDEDDLPGKCSLLLRLPLLDQYFLLDLLILCHFLTATYSPHTALHGDRFILIL